MTKVKIEADHFLNEKDAQTYRSYHEEMGHTKPDQRDNIVRHYPETADDFHGDTLLWPQLRVQHVTLLQPMLQGETRVVPDVFDIESDWAERGKDITRDLARKFPDYSETNPNPR